MKDLKTSFSFNNGVIGEVEKYEFDIPSASTVEGVKFALSPTIVQNKLNGKVSIKISDEKLYVGFDVDNKELVAILKQELAKFYTFVDLGL